MMRWPSCWGMATVLLCVTTITVVVVAYPPSCSDVFGRPTAVHCAALLAESLGNGGQGEGEEEEEDGSGFYGIAGLDRPAAVSVPQWWNRVSIPKFWSSGGFFFLFFPHAVFYCLFQRCMSELLRGL